MDFQFFHELLRIDSTSGKERDVALWLAERLPDMFPASNRPLLQVDEVGDGSLNLLLTWGTPRIVFCSHLDTVPPYIPPTFPPSRRGYSSPNRRCATPPINGPLPLMWPRVATGSEWNTPSGMRPPHK